MTRKHFIELAETVNTLVASSEVKAVLANKLATFCHKHNKDFNVDKFIKACNKKEIHEKGWY